MNSAETIDAGTFELAGYALRNLDSDQTGFVGRAGYGLTDRLDVAGRVGFYDGLFYAGGDLELWLVHDQGVDLSAGAGLHRSDFDGGADVFGIDAFAIASGRVGPQVELYGSLDLDFERPDAPRARFTLAHAVAGLEIRLARDLDLHFEGGAGLNDRSADYLAAGLAFYLR